MKVGETKQLFGNFSDFILRLNYVSRIWKLNVYGSKYISSLQFTFLRRLVIIFSNSANVNAES